MPKQKLFISRAKVKPKKEPKKLDTPDDFQAAGVDFEDAAGKWRAGDAAKSMRFFQRAADVYDQGLRKFPRSVDLAYNKARVQLEMATHPMLVPLLQRPLKDALGDSLSSHRYALELDPANADTLFNAAQVLTAIAEVKVADEEDDEADRQALGALEEALDLQGRCLSVQERKHQEFLEQEERAAREQSDLASNQSMQVDEPEGSLESAQAGQDEKWFSIVEPVTYSTLIDTLLAQLGTLTTLHSILNSSPGIAANDSFKWTEELSTRLLQKTQIFSRHQPDRLQEIALARGNLASMMLETGFRTGKLDAETYKRERDAAFAVAELQLDGSTEGLIANARSLIACNSALAEAGVETQMSYSIIRWNVLTASIANLKSASAIRGILQEELATTHLLRGDASLFLHAMAHPPTSHPTAINSAAQNAKNAEVYYRNASKLTSDEEEREISAFKSAVAQYLHLYSQGQVPGDLSKLLAASSRGRDWAAKQLEDMVAENLVPQILFS
ncbi:hypothetical protein GGS23DRAFT_210058 [Durotheca rogersii]|uniref:uncharacterized protein n=1 Tax=Durotheca rogersii TaxID=419775 RepID=UPI00221F0751|nr:uncharacterized protein GGS23DRAFT_210058 [Durotheca rogersii]KAI5860796.1 hypothetical protein GGS23DRAFT_210058 [Durotheca rogersii]